MLEHQPMTSIVNFGACGRSQRRRHRPAWRKPFHRVTIGGRVASSQKKLGEIIFSLAMRAKSKDTEIS